MSASISDPEEVWQHVWNQLSRAVHDPKHPFRTPVFATSSSASHPRSRTLVLRKALRHPGQLWCYTDRRSDKARDLEEGSHRACWTFWHPRQRLQVVTAGATDWLNAGETAEIFAALPKHSRRSYATQIPPGSRLAAPGDGLPPDWETLDTKETDYAAPHFGVLVTTLLEMDILLLDREGHRRLKASRTAATDTWEKYWVVP